MPYNRNRSKIGFTQRHACMQADPPVVLEEWETKQAEGWLPTLRVETGPALTRSGRRLSDVVSCGENEDTHTAQTVYRRRRYILL